VTINHIDISDVTIEGPHGPLPVRTYQPADRPVGGVVWVHGGASINGDLDMQESHWVAQQLSEAGFAVVTVQYRLTAAPDWWPPALTPLNSDPVDFPVASEEVQAAFQWARESQDLASPLPWSLGGASAGGNLTVGAALRLRDDALPLPESLVLAYPLLHKALPPMSTELQVKYESLPVDARLSPEIVDLLNLNYVKSVDALDNPYAFPGGHDVQGLPPTLIINSDYDALRASGEKFGMELIAAGVDVSVVREPDTGHGHLDGPESAGAQRSIRRIRAWLQEHAAREAGR
jgi:acetyl esterase